MNINFEPKLERVFNIYFYTIMIANIALVATVIWAIYTLVNWLITK